MSKERDLSQVSIIFALGERERRRRNRKNISCAPDLLFCLFSAPPLSSSAALLPLSAAGSHFRSCHCHLAPSWRCGPARERERTADENFDPLLVPSVKFHAVATVCNSSKDCRPAGNRFVRRSLLRFTFTRPAFPATRICRRVLPRPLLSL